MLLNVEGKSALEVPGAILLVCQDRPFAFGVSRGKRPACDGQKAIIRLGLLEEVIRLGPSPYIGPL